MADWFDEQDRLLRTVDNPNAGISVAGNEPDTAGPAIDYDAKMPDTRRRQIVEALYQKYLGRKGGPDEIYAWYSQNKTPAQIEADLKGSPEADNRSAFDQLTKEGLIPPAVNPNGGVVTPPGARTGTTGSGGSRADLEAAIQSFQQSHPASAENEGQLEQYLKSQGFNVSHPNGPDGQPRLDKLEFPDYGIGKDLGRFDGDGRFWSSGSYPLNGAGGSAEFGGGSLSDLGGWGTGGFGSGVFNFPGFSSGAPQIQPYGGTAPNIPQLSLPSSLTGSERFAGASPFPSFTNTTPNNPAFTNTTPDNPMFGGLSKEEFEQTPGYQETQDAAQQAVQRSAAARGTLLTGGTLKALQRNAGGIANQTYGDAYNRKLNAFGANQSANQANFGNNATTYDLNLRGNDSNYGRQSDTYRLNQGTADANFGRDLSTFGANAGAKQQDINNIFTLGGFNRDSTQLNFTNPLSLWQANNAAQSQRFNQDLSSYDTNYRTASGIHTMNISDLIAIMNGYRPST